MRDNEASNIGPDPLPGGWPLFPCLICGAAIPDKGRTFHDEWHANIAGAAIDTARRVQAMDDRGESP